MNVSSVLILGSKSYIGPRGILHCLALGLGCEDRKLKKASCHRERVSAYQAVATAREPHSCEARRPDENVIDSMTVEHAVSNEWNLQTS